MIDGYKIEKTYYDMPLRADALNGIEVMMGARTTGNDRKAIEKMLKGIPEHQIINSKLDTEI